MKGSVSQRVASHVATLPESSFVAVRDVSGPRSAVESAFSRLAASGEVARVRKGTYWKGAPTPLGVSLPRTEEVALAIGGPAPARRVSRRRTGWASPRRFHQRTWPPCLDEHRYRGNKCSSRSVRSGGCWQVCRRRRWQCWRCCAPVPQSSRLAGTGLAKWSPNSPRTAMYVRPPWTRRRTMSPIAAPEPAGPNSAVRGPGWCRRRELAPARVARRPGGWRRTSGGGDRHSDGLHQRRRHRDSDQVLARRCAGSLGRHLHNRSEDDHEHSAAGRIRLVAGIRPERVGADEIGIRLDRARPVALAVRTTSLLRELLHRGAQALRRALGVVRLSSPCGRLGGAAREAGSFRETKPAGR